MWRNFEGCSNLYKLREMKSRMEGHERQRRRGGEGGRMNVGGKDSSKRTVASHTIPHKVITALTQTSSPWDVRHALAAPLLIASNETW